MNARHPRHAITVALLFLGMAVITYPGTAYAESPATDPDVQGQVRLFSAWLDGQIAYRGLPGVVVGVVAGDKLVWAKGFGHADLETDRHMEPDTRFRMASHSKLFTATAIMQLREQGKLRLDDPVSDYLPWFRVGSAAPDDPMITIEHLLTHSSGLPREARAHWSDFEFPTQAQLQNLIPERQAAYAPEVRWKYSNLAYSVAGMIVEALSGDTWAGYLQTHIFDPLDMSASSVDQDVAELATGYTRRMPDGTRDVLPFVDARGMAAATGLTSTVEDMAKFVSAQFRQGTRGSDRILSTSSLRQMHRVRMMESTWTRGQGIGFAVSRVNNKLYVGHTGGYPGHTTNTLIQLDSKVGVIVLTNTNDSNPGGIARELMRTVGEAVAAATKVKAPVVAWDPAWERFTGLYRSPWSDSQVVLLNERLVVMTPNASRIDDSVGLEPIGDGRFRMTAPTGGGAVGETVRFVERDGEVVRMITGDSYSDRVMN